jgi:hypothetical protein
LKQLDDVGHRQAGNERAATRYEADESFDGEALECLADRCSADADSIGKVHLTERLARA